MSAHKKVLLFTGDHQLCAVSTGHLMKNWVKTFKLLISKLLARIDCSYPALFPLMSGEVHSNGTGLAACGDISFLFCIQSHSWKNNPSIKGLCLFVLQTTMRKKCFLYIFSF